MPRRRRFAPKGTRPVFRPPLDNRGHRSLQRAHRLMEIGDFVNAGDIFERVAGSAHDKGLIWQAPRLYLQAGRAYTLAGSTRQGIDLLQHGLQIFASNQHWMQFQQAGSRAVNELQQFGHIDLAKELEAWLQAKLPTAFETTQTPDESTGQKRLPLTCPACGGPLRANEIEWQDAHTGECPYCGNGIRVE